MTEETGSAPGPPKPGPNRLGPLGYRFFQGLSALSHPGVFFRQHILDPGFARNPRRYVVQAGLATVAMLIILIFVDSLSNAALAAGLASSVVTLFIHPSSRIASTRSLCGGHILALMIGSGFALLSAIGPVRELLLDAPLLSDLGLALVVAVLIFVMALTDTEHPPAAGTVLAMATRPWDIEIAGIIIAAVLLLAVVRRLIGHRLHDLI